MQEGSQTMSDQAIIAAAVELTKLAFEPKEALWASKSPLDRSGSVVEVYLKILRGIQYPPKA